MEEPLLLAQLFGLYFLIVGGVVMLRRQSIMPAIAELAANRALLLVIALVELAAGLAIVLMYPKITLDWVGLISLIGWMLVAESILYMALPVKKVQKFIKSFNTHSWYASSGVLSVIIGAYLAAIGFGIA